MTQKQKKIINSGVMLFSTKGYHATTTRLIAQNAGVSEGLIFRHFKNKEGLLEKILEISNENIKGMVEPIESLSHPKVVLKHIINIPLNMGEEQKNTLN